MAVAISNMGATWNTSPTSVNTAIMMNVNDVSSSANSKLIDLQLNSNSKFIVYKSGATQINGNATISGATSVNGTIRSTTQIVPTSGVGAEFFYFVDRAYMFGYDRSNSVFKDTEISGANIYFSTNNGTERMRVDINGNVGIGTVNPTYKLHVTGDFFSTSVTSNSISDDIGDVRNIPVNSQSTTYQLTANDAGKVISTTANITVNGAVLSVSQAFSIYNNSAANITVTQGTGATMYLAGTATTGNRTLAQRGVATVLMVGSNTFAISGAGLS